MSSSPVPLRSRRVWTEPQCISVGVVFKRGEGKAPGGVVRINLTKLQHARFVTNTFRVALQSDVSKTLSLRNRCCRLQLRESLPSANVLRSSLVVRYWIVAGGQCEFRQAARNRVWAE
ncbi:hypothetical protein TNCV_3754541, partial [Trichonephila clavipes]